MIDTAGTIAEGWAVHRPLNCEIADAAESLAAAQRRGADVELLCLDSTRPLDDWERVELARPIQSRRIIVLTKCDAARRSDLMPAALETSSLSGLGIAALKTELRRQALAARPHSEAVAGTAVRGPIHFAWPPSVLAAPANPRTKKNWPRPSCALRWWNWARSSARSTPKTSWIASSAGSASANKKEATTLSFFLLPEHKRNPARTPGSHPSRHTLGPGCHRRPADTRRCHSAP